MSKKVKDILATHDTGCVCIELLPFQGGIMRNIYCPYCGSKYTSHHHTDWGHIDPISMKVKPVDLRYCPDCKELFISE